MKKFVPTQLVLASVAIFAALCHADSEPIDDQLKALQSFGIKPDEILSEAKGIMSWIVDIRRKLHMRPELMYELKETSSIVRAVLDELKIPYTYPVAKHGIVATIGTGRAPVMALRADMDALPIVEPQIPDTLPFISQNPGAMHACGHDGHTAMLLGAARLLKAREASLAGTVRLLFQPAEEGGAGALLMAQEGALGGAAPVERAFGVHLWPWLPTGHVASRAGPLMAAAGVFEITVRGRGGHAAAGIGNGVVDPVLAAAAVVSGIHTVVSRDIRPTDEGVISITRVRAGDAYNVVPDFAVIGGTIRAFSKEVYSILEERAKHLATHTAAAYGCEVELHFTTFDHNCYLATEVPAHFPTGCTYPPTVNNASVWNDVRAAATALVGSDSVHDEWVPTMGGEDFAYFGERVPSTFAFLGIANHSKNTTAGLHTPEYKMDEEALPVGAALHVTVALQALALLAPSPAAAAAAGRTAEL